MKKIKLIMSFLLVAFLSQSVFAEKKPNFIIFLVDDLGYNDLSCYGSENVKTPNLDDMAKSGVSFTTAYVGSPVCGPSRAALMTASYPMRIAEPKNIKHGHTEPHNKELFLSQVLKEEGYATALIGKWHLGTKNNVHPLVKGFDVFYGSLVPNGGTKTIEGGTRDPMKLYDGHKSLGNVNQAKMDTLTTLYTEKSIEFIKENKDKPFFLYLSHNMPHVVLGVSDKFKGKSGKGLFYDVVMELDWSVGEIRRVLKEEGLADNTFLVFLSDNGPWVSEHLNDDAGNHYGSAIPLRGSKMMSWEGGARVPMLMEYPKSLPADKVLNDMVFSMDIMPTFIKLAGGKLPEDLIIDGVDIMPYLTGENTTAPHDYYYYYCFTKLCAVRDAKWKLVLPREAHPIYLGFWSKNIDLVEEIELYDLENDISETKNVAMENPEVVERLMKQIEYARETLGDSDRIGNNVRNFDKKDPMSNRFNYAGGFSFDPEKKSSKKKKK